ncbi:hypothetical protein DM860_014084 [Cuscuta australis]|uniref:Uncharacterized protein n=1 Tax=Cuscuta australis TaxID=267555 RepID=A0A328DDZ8_9ASTE|nr:hypothetical protein DM860_014084 [Cuscuta australis]
MYQTGWSTGGARSPSRKSSPGSLRRRRLPPENPLIQTVPFQDSDVAEEDESGGEEAEQEDQIGRHVVFQAGGKNRRLRRAWELPETVLGAIYGRSVTIEAFLVELKGRVVVVVGQKPSGHGIGGEKLKGVDVGSIMGELVTKANLEGIIAAFTTNLASLINQMAALTTQMTTNILANNNRSPRKPTSEQQRDNK